MTPARSTASTDWSIEELVDLLDRLRLLGASDLHLVGGSIPFLRRHGRLNALNTCAAVPGSLLTRFADLLAATRMNRLRGSKSASVFDSGSSGRFRVHRYIVGGEVALSIHLISTTRTFARPPEIDAVLDEFADIHGGLVVVAGPSGSGKSTTVASLVDRINASRALHIVTLDDPTEFVFESRRSLIHQREVGMDVTDLETGLAEALREDVDVIVIGDLIDPESIAPALYAAESGALVLASIHAANCAGAVEKMAGAMEATRNLHGTRRLASVLSGVIAQRLEPCTDRGGVVSSFEVLRANPAVRTSIRSGALHQVGALAVALGSSPLRATASGACGDGPTPLVTAGRGTRAPVRRRRSHRATGDGWIGALRTRRATRAIFE